MVLLNLIKAVGGGRCEWFKWQDKDRHIGVCWSRCHSNDDPPPLKPSTLLQSHPTVQPHPILNPLQSTLSETLSSSTTSHSTQSTPIFFMSTLPHSSSSWYVANF